MEEEKPKFKYKDYIPVGPNIFLAIETVDENNIIYVCLEREFKEKYIVSIWSKEKNNLKSIRRKKAIEVPTEETAEKILGFYGKQLKHLITKNIKGT
jgi:GTPase Era involved in 16S rRNA processing